MSALAEVADFDRQLAVFGAVDGMQFRRAVGVGQFVNDDAGVLRNVVDFDATVIDLCTTFAQVEFKIH